MLDIAPCNFLNKKSVMNYGKQSYEIFAQTLNSGTYLHGRIYVNFLFCF